MSAGIGGAPAFGPAAGSGSEPGEQALASLHGVRRRLRALLAAGGGAGRAGGAGDLADAAGAPLEAQALGAPEPPRCVAATPIEGHAVRARRVEVAATDAPPTLAAFLDGTQASHVVRYDAGLPVVFGTVAAVVRARRGRTMSTWASPRLERRLYAPCAYLPPRVCAALADAGVPVVDTTQPDASGERPGAHPFALLDRAVHFVQADRERAERELAELWCTREGHPERAVLVVDGSIQGSEPLAAAPCVIGIVKSHRTLYAEGSALATVLALGRAERSTVFRVSAGRRAAVASWYLRLRDPAGRDPLWGLVRVEAALPDAGAPPDALTRRADRISRAVLAEAAPLALPDARWDKLVYPIRDCEQFLRAIC